MAVDDQHWRLRAERAVGKAVAYFFPVVRLGAEDYDWSVPSLSVAIPAYNEEESLENVVRDFVAELKRHEGDFEIVLLDDGSTDRTRSIIERLAREYPEFISPIFHDRNKGMAVAFENVQNAATKDYVILLGADGQYPPDIIGVCLPHLGKCDVLICKRERKHYAFVRAAISGLYRWICRMLFGIDLFDPGGTKAFRRALIDELPVRSQSVFAQPERVIRAAWRGYRIGMTEVPCVPRRAGKAKGCSMRLILSAFRDVCLLWWEGRGSHPTVVCSIQKQSHGASIR